jgi:hypothetical protein
MVLGIGAGDLIGLVRESGRLAGDPGGVLVVGPLAEVLARELGKGADDPTVVRTAGDAGQAAAVVVVLAGELGDQEARVVRTASREHVPVVAVQTLPGGGDGVPYVLAEHVVEVERGDGFPTDRIAAALAAALGRDGAGLAARLPVLRDAVRSRIFRRVALESAIIGAAPWSDNRHFPLLTLAQARMLLELQAASGRGSESRERALTVGVPLATSFATGLVARTLFRRVPLRGPLAAGAFAVAGTAAVKAIGGAVSARLAAAPSD